jgi:hypothetical protein
MDLDEPENHEAEPETFEEGAEDWDEETLGLDFNEADAQTLVREVVPTRGFGD